jgi:hypothetical protein
VTPSPDIRIDEISQTVECDHTCIAPHHRRGVGGGEFGGGWATADTAEQPEAYLLDQETEVKRNLPIDGGYVESRNRE